MCIRDRNNSQGRASLFAADPSGNGNRGKGNCKGQCFLVHNRGGNTKLYKGGRRNCRISDRSFLKVLSEKALFTDQELSLIHICPGEGYKLNWEETKEKFRNYWAHKLSLIHI